MHKPTALVIDDDVAIATGVKIRLGHAGFDVSTAGDGEEGLAKIQREDPDVILLDVRMPNMDGLTVLKHLRLDSPRVADRVVMLSASLQDREVALESGAKYFLTKPYRGSDLIDAVDAIVHHAHH